MCFLIYVSLMMTLSTILNKLQFLKVAVLMEKQTVAENIMNLVKLVILVETMMIMMIMLMLLMKLIFMIMLVLTLILVNMLVLC